MRARVSDAEPLLLLSLLGRPLQRCHIKINEEEGQETQAHAPIGVQSSWAEGKEDVPPLQAQVLDDWDELERLVKAHRFTCNRNRTNLGGPCVWYGQRRCLKTGVYSNTRKQGPILEHCRSMLGESISCVTLNRNVQCGVHRDRRNSSKSWKCFLGYFTGGSLCLEDG